MINFRYPIRGTYRSVVRPVSVKVLQDIKAVLNLDHTMSVTLNNEVEAFITNQQTTPIKRPRLTPLLEEFEFTVDEVYDENTLITNGANYNEYPAVIFDKDVGAFIRTVYIDSKINFSIKLMSRSKSTISRIFNELKIRMSQNEAIHIHSTPYTYYIPEKILELFLDIYEIKESVKPTGESFEDYLIRISEGSGLTLVGAVSGKWSQADFAIKETQREITGYFESDVVSTVKGDNDPDKALWTGTFTYVINFNKPVALSVGYEPVAYNKLLPSKYVTIVNSERGEYDTTKKRTLTGENFHLFSGRDTTYDAVQAKVNRNPMLNIPNFDEFMPSQTPSFCTRVFSVLIGVDAADPRNLFNLAQIPGYTIEASLISFIANGEHANITRRMQSVFMLELFNGSNLDPNVELLVDADLNVTSTADLDVTKTYRVVFSIVTDLSVITDDAIMRADASGVMYDAILPIIGIDATAINNAKLFKQKLTMIRDKRLYGKTKRVQVSHIIALNE